MEEHERKLVESVKRKFGRGGVIAFTSFGHGFGRSYVKERLAEILRKDEELGDRVVSLSTGDIFRQMAEEKGFRDIGEFARFLRENPEEAQRIDTEIDKRVRKKVRELVKEGKIVLIDSNLHAWPHALEDIPSITFVVYARPEVVGKRLVEKQRKGEKRYSSPEEALEAQMRRTREDIARYKRLAEAVKDSELKRLYELGARRLARALRAYRVHFKGGLPNERIVRILMGADVHVIDNSGDIRETLRQVARAL